MITAGCFVNYQLNQPWYCNYNGVCLLDNWRQKGLENKERKSTEIWHEKIVQTNTPRGINITKWYRVWKPLLTWGQEGWPMGQECVHGRATKCCWKPCGSCGWAKDFVYLLQGESVGSDLRCYLWVYIYKTIGQGKTSKRGKRNSVNDK